MKITILRARKSIADPNLLYCDVECDLGFVIKGVIYKIKKNQAFLPQMWTEGGKPFTPFVLLPEIKMSFLEQFLELIQEFPMPKNTEEVTHEKREEILAKYAHRKAQAALHDRSSRQKKDPSSPAPSGGPQLSTKKPGGDGCRGL